MLQALNGGRRLVAHHASILMPQLHSFVLLAMPSIEALRSTTSKTAMLLVQVATLLPLPPLTHSLPFPHLPLSPAPPMPSV